MAITRAQTTGATGSGTQVTATFANDTVQDQYIVAQIASSVAASSASDTQGNTFTATQAETVVNTNNRTRTYLAKMDTGWGAGHGVNANFGSSSAVALTIAEYDTDGDTLTIEQTNAGTGFGTAPSSGNITTTTANALLTGSLVWENTAGDGVTPGTNWTEVRETTRGNNTPAGGQLMERIVSSTGTYTTADASHTLGGTTNWASQIVALTVTPPVTCALTGTLTTSSPESEVVSGGQTIIATMTNDTYVASTVISDITFQANALGGTTTTTSFSITLPTTQANDIIILEFCHRGTGNGTIGGTYSGPAFTLKHSQTFGASSAFSGKTYYSRASGNHSTQTVTGSSLTDSCAAIVTVYRGAVESGDPLSDATVVGEENASGNETQAAITTATDKAMVVLVVVNSPDFAISAQSCTTPGTLTERAERLSTGGTDSSVAHASAVRTTAGSTGSFTWTQTDSASGSWAYAIVPKTTTPFADARAAIRDGIDSAQSESGGWDAKVKPNIPLANIVRTSDTVCTVTLQAQSDYAITADETLTMTIPASALTGAVAVVATPTIAITNEGTVTPLTKQTDVVSQAVQRGQW